MIKRSASPPGYRLSAEAGNRALEPEAKLGGDWQPLFGLFYFLWDSIVDQVMNNSGYLQLTDKEHTASSSKIKSESNKIDWSLMPRQLFSKIFAHLPTAADCITFVSVCRSWHFNIDFESPIPWLVGRQNDPPREIPIFDFFSVFRYNLFPVKGGAACRTIMCRSSSRGWIILMDIRATGTFLMLWNPVTNLRIELPPIIAPSHYSDAAAYAIIYKIIISGDPAVCNKWMALATFIVGMDFCFYRSGDLGWTFFGFSQPNSEVEFNKDVEFYNERFYIAKSVQIFRCELEPTPQVIRLQPVEIFLKQDIVETFLVECSKELLFIVIRPGAAKVYKLKFEDNIVAFSELKDLGDWALFLGRNHSFAVDVDVFPRCLRNSIYLTDNNTAGSITRAKVINLKDQSIKTITYPIVNDRTKAQPFFWFLPSERISKHFEISIPEV